MSEDRQAEPAPVPSLGTGSSPLLDLCLGLAFTIGGVALFYSSRGFAPMIPNSVIGPGLLPSICAVAFAVFGAALSIGALRRVRAGEAVDRGEDGERGSLPFSSVVLGGLVLVIVLMPYLGFIVASAAYGFAVTWAGKSKWWGAALSSGLITLFVYYLFSDVMRVPLPRGSLFF